MDFPFLKEETFGLRTQETFTGTTCEVYIPVGYLNKNDARPMAKELGNRLETIGLFWFRVDGKDWYELQMPIKFQLEFSERTKETARIRPGMPSQDYYVYTLHNGQAFVYDVLHQKKLEDITKDFVTKLLEGGKMPTTIRYSDVFNVVLSAMEVTGRTNIGITAASLELLLAELYRCKGNLSQPFRLNYNGKNDYEYKMVNIKALPGINSTFTSILGENIQNQLTSSILRTREGKLQTPSVLEKVIKY